MCSGQTVPTVHMCILHTVHTVHSVYSVHSVHMCILCICSVQSVHTVPCADCPMHGAANVAAILLSDISLLLPQCSCCGRI